VLLLVLDAIYGRKLAHSVEERLGESLQGTADLASADLALVRGHLDLSGLSVVRDDALGHLSLKVDDVRCELAPLGAAIVWKGCSELAIRGIRLEVSTAALFKLRPPKRRPIATERVIIDDAELAFSPSAFLPNLGRVAIHIEHAVAGPTTFHTPMAWLLTMQALDAHVDLPAGLRVDLHYADGLLSARGALFGAQPVTVPLTFPPTTDARSQIDALVKAGKQLAEDLVAKRAQDWIDSKL
jgi:hypothetical protein